MNWCNLHSDEQFVLKQYNVLALISCVFVFLQAATPSSQGQKVQLANDEDMDPTVCNKFCFCSTF